MDPTVPLTLMIALIGVVVVFAARPALGLVAYLAILYLYPDYLRVSLETVDISATRIVGTLLLIRCFSDSAVMRQFRWHTLDTLVVISVIIYAAALASTTEMETWFENRSGFAMDSVFAYLAVRLVINDRAAFMNVAKALAVIAIPLTLGGIVETFTGYSIYVGLGKYCKWAYKGMEYQTRYGLNRAMGPNGETILFGLSMAVLVPIIWALRYESWPWSRRATMLALVAAAGVASTISSGPYLALAVGVGCLALERAKNWVKPLIIMFVLGCVSVEMVSNRHFYYVLGDYTMDSDSAWYRARLVDVAIERIPEYWTAGYGLRDPGWGPDINGLKYTDVVNDFVACAVQTGLIGLTAYLAVLAAAIGGAVHVYRRTHSPWLRSCSWALVAALLGLLAASWSVSLFGNMVTVLYVLLGMLGALPQLARATASEQDHYDQFARFLAGPPPNPNPARQSPFAASLRR